MIISPRGSADYSMSDWLIAKLLVRGTRIVGQKNSKTPGTDIDHDSFMYRNYTLAKLYRPRETSVDGRFRDNSRELEKRVCRLNSISTVNRCL